MTKDIRPTTTLNRKFAFAIAVIAALPLYLGVNSMTFLPRDEWTWSAVPLSIGLVLLMLAARAWFSPPMNTARITFRDRGFRMETKQIFRGERSFELDWAEIKSVAKYDGGLYGARSIRVWYGPGEDFALFAASWTDASGFEIIERFAASAEAAGYLLEKDVGFWKGLVRERWLVRERA